jgi:transposase-like protein
MNLVQFSNAFNSQRKCIRHLESIRWKSGPVCPYCKSTSFSTKKVELRYRCCSCNRSYSVLVGTLFHASKLPLPVWFVAIYLIKDAKKGISSLQLSRHLNVNKNTAWFLQSRIRKAMKEELFINGVIEVDETFIGGSTSNMHKSYIEKKGYHTDGKEHKMTVLGMLERNGSVILEVIPKANKEFIRPILNDRINRSSEIITDGHGSYVSLKNEFPKHISLNHKKGERKKGKYHLSTIEGFWALLKRAVIGTYHAVSLKHLQSYMDEIAFKYNHKRENLFNCILDNLLKSNHAFI